MKTTLGKHWFTAVLLLSLVFFPGISAKAQDPWDFLAGFKLIPGSQGRLDEAHVAALFVNQEERLLAFVIFKSTCDLKVCKVNHPSAYSVFNAEGANVRCYVDPEEPIGASCNELPV